MTIRDILEDFKRGVISAHNNNYGENVWNAEDYAQDQAEQAINAYILGEVMELINSCYDKDYGIDSVALRNKANERWGSDGY